MSDLDDQLSYDTAADQARLDAADATWSRTRCGGVILSPDTVVVRLNLNGGEILALDHMEEDG